MRHQQRPHQGHVQGLGGHEQAHEGGASDAPKRAAIEFLRGKRQVTAPVTVGLHQLVPSVKLVEKLISASKHGARLGAAVGPVKMLRQLLSDPAFDWGPKGKGGHAGAGGGGGRGGAHGGGGGGHAAPGGKVDRAGAPPEVKTVPDVDISQFDEHKGKGKGGKKAGGQHAPGAHPGGDEAGGGGGGGGGGGAPGGGAPGGGAPGGGAGAPGGSHAPETAPGNDHDPQPHAQTTAGAAPAAGGPTPSAPTAQGPAPRHGGGPAPRPGGPGGASPSRGPAPRTSGRAPAGAAPASGGGGGAGGVIPAAPSGRTPDGLVDHYMETHWDSSEFYAKVSELGHYPDAVGSELDHWLPPGISPGARGALNLAAGAAAGILDAAVMGVAQAIPGIGLPFILFSGIKSLIDVHNNYGAQGVNDPLGEKLAMTRGVIDLVGSLTSNLADVCTVIEDCCHAVAWAGGVSEILGVPVTAIGEVLRGISLGCAGGKLLLDGMLFENDREHANAAEAQGDFAKAGKYRDLMFGDVVNSVKDGISFVMTAINVFSVNTTGGGGAAASLEDALVKATFKNLGGKGDMGSGAAWKLPIAKKAAPGALGATKTGTLGNGAGDGHGLGTIFANAKAAVGLGDPMAANPDALFGEHFISRNSSVAGSGAEHDILQSARAETIAKMNTDYGALTHEPPAWTQKLVNDIAKGPAGPTAASVMDSMTPSGQIKAMLGGIRGMMGLIGDGSLDSMAAGCDRAAGFLQSFVDPAMKKLNGWISENKPHLNKIVESWNESLQKQDLNLKQIEQVIQGAQNIVGKGAQFADKGQWLEQKADQLIGMIGGLHATREKLHVPSVVPDFVVNPFLTRYNGLIDSLMARARQMKTDALAKLSAEIHSVTKVIQDKIAYFQKIFGEGSAFRQAVKTQFDHFKALVDEATKAFVQWDGQVHIDISGAGTWLKSVAQRARASTHKAGEDRWKKEVLPMAQGKVNKWIGDHAAQVKTQYFPTVPANEVAALQRVKGMLLQKLAPHLSSRNPAEQAEARQAQSAINSAGSAGGGQGKAALLAVWAAEDTLAQIAMRPIFRRPVLTAGGPGEAETDPNAQGNGQGQGNHPPGGNAPRPGGAVAIG